MLGLACGTKDVGSHVHRDAVQTLAGGVSCGSIRPWRYRFALGTGQTAAVIILQGSTLMSPPALPRQMRTALIDERPHRLP
ncbi:hypothetical protein XvhCFBP2543_16550 [Xanthomonas vasicola]|nr:hypothetical protein NX79_16085 [Xanthomonas vasicola]PPV01579.1 hypothetical protein XvhCFBP2543_16550 [Xanthomonas vasicola]